MLSNVLLKHVFWTSLVVIGAVALLMSVIVGTDAGVAVVAGGFLLVFDGAALVYLIGRLLDPGVSGGTKSLLTLLLIGKFTIVAGLLWLMLAELALNPLGLIVGMGAGITALVFGLNRGSTSDDGVAAIEEAEERIAQEMGDKDDELR